MLQFADLKFIKKGSPLKITSKNSQQGQKGKESFRKTKKVHREMFKIHHTFKLARKLIVPFS